MIEEQLQRIERRQSRLLYIDMAREALLIQSLCQSLRERGVSADACADIRRALDIVSETSGLSESWAHRMDVMSTLQRITLRCSQLLEEVGR
jgi:hypothetical protein